MVAGVPGVTASNLPSTLSGADRAVQFRWAGDQPPYPAGRSLPPRYPSLRFLYFPAFYLNRTNRSGIIKGGVIGGKEQSGNWTMDVRFHQGHLAERIREISGRKAQIHLYNKDINSFLLNYAPKYSENALIYFDPPYYEKGKELYMNFLQHKDHVRIKSQIECLKEADWVITYDDCPQILELYRNHICRRMSWNYSAATKRSVDEIIIFPNTQMIPSKEELCKGKVHTMLRDVGTAAR